MGINVFLAIKAESRKESATFRLLHAFHFAWEAALSITTHSSAMTHENRPICATRTRVAVIDASFYVIVSRGKSIERLFLAGGSIAGSGVTIKTLVGERGSTPRVLKVSFKQNKLTSPIELIFP